MAVLGLCCCLWAFSSCKEQGLLSSCCAAHFCSFSCCRAKALGVQASAVAACRLKDPRAHGFQKLWHVGLAAPRRVGSSQTRDQNRVHLCIGRWILLQCAKGEVRVHLKLMTLLWKLEAAPWFHLPQSKSLFSCWMTDFVYSSRHLLS